MVSKMFNDNVLRVVNWLRKQMIALRPRDQHVWDPRPLGLPHETKAETKTNYRDTETETETKKVVSRPKSGLETTMVSRP